MTRIGILGGGQLAQMLIQAAISLGLETAIYERKPDSPASLLTHHHAVGDWSNEVALMAFSKNCDVLTLENEFVDATALQKLEAEGISIYPTPATLAIIQDKLRQKQCYEAVSLPVPTFRKVNSANEVMTVADELGLPLVLKARYGGYDGYGNATIRTLDDIGVAWEKLSRSKGGLMVEKFVPFQRELAVMVLRGRDGEVRAYPVVETVQRNHICHMVRAPAVLPDDVARRAVELATQAVQAVGGIGVFGVELFLLLDNSVLLNEIAPRPHNSGHYTIEGCVTSQFENHLRAVLGLPLGSTAMRSPAAVMVNLLGSREGETNLEGIREALTVEGAHLHLYGKREVRQGRKMGHVTVLANSLDQAEAVARRAADLVEL